MARRRYPSLARKAQAERAFLYIMTVLIVAMILIFGYKAVMNITKTGAAAQKVKFQNDFRNAIDEGKSYGRITTHTFAVGDGYSELCMVDEDAITDPDQRELSLVENSLIKGSVSGGATDNAFLVMRDGGIEPYRVEPLDVASGGKCFAVASGRVRIQTKGLGDTVEVRDAPDE